MEGKLSRFFKTNSQSGGGGGATNTLFMFISDARLQAKSTNVRQPWLGPSKKYKCQTAMTGTNPETSGSRVSYHPVQCMFITASGGGGGDHEYIGGMSWVHRGNVMMHLGDIISTLGNIQYIGGTSWCLWGISWVHRGILSTSEGYHDSSRGCHDMFSTSEHVTLLCPEIVGFEIIWSATRNVTLYSLYYWY